MKSLRLGAESILALGVSLCWPACGGSDAPSSTAGPSSRPSSTNIVAERAFSYQAAASPQSTLSVSGVNGTITITKGASGTVTISGVRRVGSDSFSDAQSRLEGLQVQVTTVGSEIRVETSQPVDTQGRNYVVNYEIGIPANIHVSARNDNGDISLIDTSGNVQVRLTNGSIRSRATLPRDGTIDQSTVNGSIELSIPASSNAELSASVTNGSISVSGLELQGQVATSDSLRGTLGDGRGTIALRTVNGNITIRAS